MTTIALSSFLLVLVRYLHVQNEKSLFVVHGYSTPERVGASLFAQRSSDELGDKRLLAVWVKRYKENGLGEAKELGGGEDAKPDLLSAICAPWTCAGVKENVPESLSIYMHCGGHSADAGCTSTHINLLSHI
uniref:Alpha/beta-Hydrolases superfamily protein n=1 Tax=Steinernema glaseri TaxID=37863 RepID=A0A1I8AT46_9BILA